MVQIPTTQRKFYDTSAKVNSLAVYADALKPAMQNAQQIFMAQQKVKIDTQSTKARIEADEYVNNMRLQYQGNPDSPEFKQAIQGGLSDIFERYGADIDPIAKGEWNVNANKMMGAYDLSNNEWVIKQRAQNAKLDVAEKMALDYDLAYSHGLNGNGAAGSAELAESYNNLFEYAKNNMGETEARKLLKDYNRKYVLNYVNGLMNSNPAEANRILDDEGVRSSIGEKQAETLKEMAQKQSVKAKKKNDQLQKDRQENAMLRYLSKPDKTIADLEALKENFYPDMSEAEYNRLLKKITEKNEEAQTDTKTDIETAKELQTTVNMLNSVGLGGVADTLSGLKKFVEGVQKKNKDGKLSLKQAQTYQNLAVNAVDNPETKKALQNMPDFSNFTKIVPVPARKPQRDGIKPVWFEEGIQNIERFDKFRSKYDELKQDAQNADSEEKQRNLMKKADKLSRVIAYEEANGRLESREAKNMMNDVEDLLVDNVFKQNLGDMPEFLEGGGIFGWYYRKAMQNQIDYIAKDTMSNCMMAMAEGDYEGANQIYEKGIQEAIMVRYRRFIPKGTKLEPGKTILNLEGTPCTFMGFGATDICVKVDD